METIKDTAHERLERLAEEFSKWRATRASRRESLPDSLLDQAVELTQYLPQKVVCARLRLDHARVRRQREQQTGSQPSATSTFVELMSSTAESGAITLRRPGGLPLTISGLSGPQLGDLIQSLLGPSSCYS